MNNPIGILDSGVGGLSIWKEVVRELPHEPIIYFADSFNCPYGAKNPEKIYQLAKKIVAYLLEKDCKLIIIACNTITVNALDRLRSDFPNVPLIGVVPVVKMAAEKTRNNVIGVLSTEATARSEYQKNLIRDYASHLLTVNLGTNRIVPLIESGDTEGLQKILPEILEPFREKKADVVALGCSHFPLIKDEIQEVLGPGVLLLDSGEAIARQATRIVIHNAINSSENKPYYEFYTSGDKDAFKKVLYDLTDTDYEVYNIIL